MEVWFEHTTAEGKVYYSNSKTQKTTWECPVNAHILPFAGEEGREGLRNRVFQMIVISVLISQQLKPGQTRVLLGETCLLRYLLVSHLRYLLASHLHCQGTPN